MLLGAVALLLIRGVYLGRPITARHAAAAAVLVLGGVGAHLLTAHTVRDVLILAAAASLVAPAASKPDPAAVQRIWPLIEATHGDPLAPFAMNAQKSYHLNSEGTAAVAYRTRLGYAVVSGDPVGHPEAFPDVVASFAAMCRSRGWRIVVLGCSAERISLWRNAEPSSLWHSAGGLGGPRAVPIGCDVVVDVAHFSMDGRRFRNLRQAVARSRNRGITTEVVAERDLDGATAAELTEVLYAAHRSARVERGFSMILDSALEGRYPGVVLMIGRDADGRVQGFHRYLLAGGGSDVTLDVPWRRPGAPNGLDERLTTDMIDWCKPTGTQRLSLAFAAFPDLFDKSDRSVAERFYYRLITLGNPLISLESLYRYLGKFHAMGQPRYVLVAVRHIPLALVVLLSLEFLPRRRKLALSTRESSADSR